MTDRVDINGDSAIENNNIKIEISKDSDINLPNGSPFVSPEIQPKFKSSFKSWIRTVAVVVILTFLPEQASWAFNYNPAVLWKDKQAQHVENPDASPEEVASTRIAASIENLLNQIAYKQSSRIQLKIPNASVSDPELNDRSLEINSDVFFTNNRIKEISSWLRDADIHPLNCGVHALRDLLLFHGIETSLE